MVAIRVGVIQMTSTADLPANLEAAQVLDPDGGRTAALNSSRYPRTSRSCAARGSRFPCAQGLDGEIVGVLRELARQAWHLAAGRHVPRGDPGPEANPQHQRADRAQRGLERRLSQDPPVRRGPERVAAAVPTSNPPSWPRERRWSSRRPPLAVSGCRFVTTCASRRSTAAWPITARGFLAVPSAFTRETGKDHWEVLLRARAIENQAFVIAPAQCGQHSPDRRQLRSLDDRRSLGPRARSCGATDPQTIVADCDLIALEALRADLPALQHRRL